MVHTPPDVLADNHEHDSVGETASELVHRHLHDQEHETTDEEMKNIQLELGDEDDNEAERNAYEERVSNKAASDNSNAGDNDVSHNQTIVTPLDI